jgi:hypothetical protein
MRDVIHFIIVLILSIPVMYILYYSDIHKNKRYGLFMVIFIILHFCALFYYDSLIGNILVIFSLLGILLTYYLWWIHKKGKRLVDFLKLTWVVVFILTYFMSWHNFQTYCSFCDNYYAGIASQVGPKYLEYIQLTNYFLLLSISFLVGYNRTQKNTVLKNKRTKTHI